MDKKNETSVIYETLLSVPGMNDTVKVDLKVSRKIILLLAQVLENGLKQREGNHAGLLVAMPNASADELRTIVDDCLAKAGLTELHGKLKGLTPTGG